MIGDFIYPSAKLYEVETHSLHFRPDQGRLFNSLRSPRFFASSASAL